MFEYVLTPLCVSGLGNLTGRWCASVVAHFTHPYRMAALVSYSRCCPGSTRAFLASSSPVRLLSRCRSTPAICHLCHFAASA